MSRSTLNSNALSRRAKWLWVPILFYLLLVFLFAVGAPLPYLLAWPVTFLALSSLFLLPCSLTAAFLFCALGDLSGQLGSFLFQLLFFALGHICFILFFARHHAMANKHRHLLLRIILIILISWAYAAIAVRVADLFLRIAIVVYIFLIAAMAYEACRFGSRFTAVGGWLFIVSDAVLAYNKFVAGIPNAGILIMSTYYLAQLFLFSGTAIKEPTAGNACIPLPRKHR